MDKEKLAILTKFVDETKQLTELKISIYKDIELTGWFGTEAFYSRFIPLFSTMRKFYINENLGAGLVLGLSTQEMKDFCQHYVDEYEFVKALNNKINQNKLGISK